MGVCIVVGFFSLSEWVIWTIVTLKSQPWVPDYKKRNSRGGGVVLCVCVCACLLACDGCFLLDMNQNYCTFKIIVLLHGALKHKGWRDLASAFSDILCSCPTFSLLLQQVDSGRHGNLQSLLLLYLILMSNTDTSSQYCLFPSLLWNSWAVSNSFSTHTSDHLRAVSELTVRILHDVFNCLNHSKCVYMSHW